LDVKNTLGGGICVRIGSKSDGFSEQLSCYYVLKKLRNRISGRCLPAACKLKKSVKISEQSNSKHCITNTNGIEVLLLSSDTVGRMLRPALLVVTIMK